jgi:hypothetical protein
MKRFSFIILFLFPFLLFEQQKKNLRIKIIDDDTSNPLGQKVRFLRIKSGRTVFDLAYFFNTRDYSITGITGNHIDYLQHSVQADNGIVYSAGNIPALTSSPSDYVKDRTFGSFKVDIINQSITKLKLPYFKGYPACVLPFEDRILFGLSTSTGVGIYPYNIATNTGRDTSAVTQGDPNILLKFH